MTTLAMDVQAPLIIGMDITDDAALEAVWPILSNVSPGILCELDRSYPASRCLSGWQHSITLTPALASIAWVAQKEAIAVNQQWAGHPGRQVLVDPKKPTQSWQIWAKKMPDGQAVFVVNAGSAPVRTAAANLLAQPFLPEG